MNNDPAASASAAAENFEGGNPYLASRRVWNSHVGALIASRRIWQLVGLVALLVVLACVGGLIHIGSQSKFVPYVVEVDKLGQAIAVAPAAQAQPADPRVVGATLASFITDLRTVSPDSALQRRAVFRAYAIIGQGTAAMQKSNDWFNGPGQVNPFKRAATETVNVQIDSVLPQSAGSWQVEWIETVYDRAGKPMSGPYRMRALLNVQVANPPSNTNEQQLRDNPLGIYVTDFSWSKQI